MSDNRAALVGFSAQEQVELGARMAGAGLDSAEVRSLVSIMEAAAKQLALSMVPTFMQLTQDTHRSACMAVEKAIYELPSKLSYIDRSEAIRAVRRVAQATPKHE